MKFLARIKKLKSAVKPEMFSAIEPFEVFLWIDEVTETFERSLLHQLPYEDRRYANLPIDCFAFLFTLFFKMSMSYWVTLLGFLPDFSRVTASLVVLFYLLKV